jgi:hypothetical protein
MIIISFDGILEVWIFSPFDNAACQREHIVRLRGSALTYEQ